MTGLLLGHEVHIIGPSGAGKSTFLKTLETEVGDSWVIPPAELVPASVRRGCFSAQVLRLVAAKAMSLSSRNLSPLEKISLLKYFTRVALQDFQRQAPYLDQSRNYLIDEGTFLNFVPEHIRMSDKNFRNRIENKSFIYLRPKNPETAVDRILKRSSEGGHVVLHHRDLNQEWLTQLTQASIREMDNLVARLKSHGSPVLTLVAEQKTDLKLASSVTFIKNRKHKKVIPKG